MEPGPDRELWDPARQARDEVSQRRTATAGLAAAWERVWRLPLPFYREKYQAAGLSVGTLPPLDAIPLTRKDELRMDEQAHPPFGRHRSVHPGNAARVSATTGTTGRPWLIFYTGADLDRMVDLQFQHTWRIGLRPGQHFAHSWPGGMYPTAVLGGRHLLDLGILEIPTGPPFTPDQAIEHLELWRRLGIDALMCTGSQLQTYDAAASAAGWDLAELLSGCHLAFVEASCQFTGPRRRVERAYRLLLHNISGAAEVPGFVTSDCRFHTGMHIPVGHHLFQICDPGTGRELPPGERGTLVVSSWGMDAFCLRYDIEDVAVAVAGRCPCGQVGPRYTLIGRAADRAVVHGRWVLPLDVQLVLEDLGAPEFLLVAGQHDQLRLRVESDHADAVQQELSRRLDLPVTVEPVAAGTLPRAAFKPRRVIASEAGSG